MRYLALFLGVLMSLQTCADNLTTEWISPSLADPNVTHFTDENYVVTSQNAPSSPDTLEPLFVFLPGTNGRAKAVTDFLNFVAAQGYRVIGLQYDDVPAVAGVCPQNPDPNCSEQFRRKRLYFQNPEFNLITDTQSETIQSRLVSLLKYLDSEHPSAGWGLYLDAAGLPNWPKIALSGLSQGAGMAAFVAKEHPLFRVVLFSSPWDEYGQDKTLAPWINSNNLATPSQNWYAAYHQSENTAALIARAYSALSIPTSNIIIFNFTPQVLQGNNPYHPASVCNRSMPRTPDGQPALIPQWLQLIGYKTNL